MASVCRVFLAGILVVVTSAANQAPCCYPKQFTALQESYETGLLNGTFLTYERSTEMAYDAINERLAEITNSYNDVTQVFEKTKVIYDYKKSKKYIIEGSHCRVKNLPYSFSEMCIPPIAVFDETVPIGLGDALPVSSFHFLIPSTSPTYNLLVRYSVGAEGCIPYQLGMFATEKGTKGTPSVKVGPVPPTHSFYPWVTPTAGTTQQLSSAFQYSNYHEGINDPSFWFDPPAGCLPRSHGPEGGDVGQLEKAPTLKQLLEPR